MKSQKDFIHRNYYIFRRDHKEVPKETTPKKQRGLSQGVIPPNQEVFNRLAAPKRFFRSREDIRAITASKKKFHFRLDPVSVLKADDK